MAPVLAGVDGCPRGWIAVIGDGGGLRAEVFGSFSATVASLPDEAIIAVDMPIGLPEKGGRSAERAARAHLAGRQSSVFPFRRVLLSMPKIIARAVLCRWNAPTRHARFPGRLSGFSRRSARSMNFALRSTACRAYHRIASRTGFCGFEWHEGHVPAEEDQKPGESGRNGRAPGLVAALRIAGGF